MERWPSGFLTFVRILSVAWAIVGMEFDVMSGPLALETFPKVLCRLWIPGLSSLSPRAGERLPSESTPNEPGESLPQVCCAIWPSAMITARVRNRESARVSIDHSAVLFKVLTPTFPTVLRDPLSPSMSADLPLRLCRFHC